MRAWPDAGGILATLFATTALFFLGGMLIHPADGGDGLFWAGAVCWLGAGALLGGAGVYLSARAGR